MKGSVAGIQYTRWKPWFAWRPVRTDSGQRVWLKRIYRRFAWAFIKRYGEFEYGTEFDILKG